MLSKKTVCLYICLYMYVYHLCVHVCVHVYWYVCVCLYIMDVNIDFLGKLVIGFGEPVLNRFKTK